MERSLIALLSGPDQPGLVARVAGWIYEHGGNIIHADQHRDQEAGIFFQRIEWSVQGESRADEAAFADFARGLGMAVRVEELSFRSRVAVMVSKFDHCFHDLALRSKAGEFPADIVGTISNHPDLQKAAEGYDLPYHLLPVLKGKKAEAEQQQLDLLRSLKVDLVVLARYMQVLSEDFLDRVDCPVINIHHSFLPAFAGGRPYHQAYNRGVKLIGATAHYVTPVLDDGPIIVQDVARVTHRHNVNDLIRKGRDLEKTVLAQAVRFHLEHRILVYNNKTVVFD
jgi:formyltetrahydrofolate deformylase